MPIVQKKNINENIRLGIWCINESTEELIMLLNNNSLELEVKSKTSNEIRIKQWLSVRLLLKEFYPELEIFYTEYGKPYLKNGTEISISHSGKYVVLLLNTQKSCGVDIEQISEKVNKIKFKFLNNKELNMANSIEKLTIFWCLKEALYKLYGKKELIFKEQLLVESITDSIYKGTIKFNNTEEIHELRVEKIEDFILVYTI
ncbi:MAG: 4'-phosphopantetheinyl transferase superfamily protein [Flavobacteriales bacterium]|nr:4'-phosphopantetheinyl transferase superfamily protein [Flavobacteriales bacterium]